MRGAQIVSYWRAFSLDYWANIVSAELVVAEMVLDQGVPVKKIVSAELDAIVELQDPGFPAASIFSELDVVVEE